MPWYHHIAAFLHHNLPQMQGYRIWIFSLVVLPIYRIPEATM